MAYAASKAALMNLTTNLARGLAPEVRVNAVAPGMIRTPWTIRFGQDWEDRSVEMTCLNGWERRTTSRKSFCSCSPGPAT